MKLKLSGVQLDEVKTSQSKKGSGGCYSKMKLTCMLTASVRKAIGIGGDTDQPWPPEGEKSGRLKGSFDTTGIILTAKQGSLLESVSEADIAISLADSFAWKFNDPKDESDHTTLITFWARTDDLTASQLMNAYFYSIQGGESTAVLSYNRPDDGNRVDMTPDPNQMHLVSDEQRQAVADMPAGEGEATKAPTHAEKVAERKAETARKAALRKGGTALVQ